MGENSGPAETDDDRAVLGNGLRSEGSLEFAKIAPRPAVARRALAGKPGLRPGDRDVLRTLVADVDEADRNIAILERLHERPSAGNLLVERLDSERILVELEHLVVREELERPVVEEVEDGIRNGTIFDSKTLSAWLCWKLAK